MSRRTKNYQKKVYMLKAPRYLYTLVEWTVTSYF